MPPRTRKSKAIEKRNEIRYAEVVPKVQDIIAQYSGMKLTLRQIFYRLVAGWHIVNTQQAYKKLGEQLVRARRRGDISYDAIEDRTREVKTGDRDEESSRDYFQGWLDHLKRLDEYYDLPRWRGQRIIPIVFVEKEALTSVFEEITRPLKVDLIVLRGYSSLTLLYELSNRLRDISRADRVDEVLGLYFGDYDPSGADIERAAGESLEKDFNTPIRIERIAITREQIERYNIPPAPAKDTDSRTNRFKAREGVAWQVELDAIEPRILQDLIRDSINDHFDKDAYSKRNEEQGRRRDEIREWVKDSLKEAEN